MKFREQVLCSIVVATSLLSACTAQMSEEDAKEGQEGGQGGEGGPDDEVTMGARPNDKDPQGADARAGAQGGKGGAEGNEDDASPGMNSNPDGSTPPQGGTGGAATPDAGAPVVTNPPGLVPAIVGVGYAGVKIRSLDNGLTWRDRTQLAASGGDDPNLLRAVAYGKGLWATGGWKYLTSTDAVTWTQQSVHPCGGGVVDGLAFGNDMFVAACGESTYVSSDGFGWRRAGRFGSGGHPKVVFGNGTFAAFGDAGAVFRSTDAMTWTRWDGMRDAAFCSGELKSRAACNVPSNGAWGNGVWVKGYTPALGGGGIFRSTNGTNYTRVSQTNVEALAFGFVTP